MFNGCTSLTRVSLYPPKDPVSMKEMFHLSAVLNIECLGSNKMTPTNLSLTFREMPSTANYVYPTDKWDFSKCTKWIYAWYGTNSNLLDLSGHTLNLKSNDNPFHHGKFLNLTGATIFLPDERNEHGNMRSFNAFEVVNLTNATIKGHFRKHFVANMNNETGQLLVNNTLKEVIIDGAVFADEESRNWEGIFEKCVKLQKDVIIPNNITNVTNAFKDCTSMTHIHSNWNNSYTNGIASTDCYAGCTGITHIDDVELGVNEYKRGLDEVPEDWGGYGFEDSNTSVVVLDIPSDNYEVTVTMRVNFGDNS